MDSRGREDEYQNLEPWIQWVSFYTGQSFSEHKIFHLGDTEKKGTTETIFQKMERKGLRVGALSPMNAVNHLQKASFFIPEGCNLIPI